MKRWIICLLCWGVFLFGYSDRDMDGVDDRYDHCPDTALSDLVDLNGCTIKHLRDMGYFDMRIGTYLMKDRDFGLIENSLQIGYSTSKFTVRLRGSYFDGDRGAGLNDTYLSGEYLLYRDSNFFLYIGGGLVLPTYQKREENRLDLEGSFLLQYTYEDWRIFGSEYYTIVGDQADESQNYEDMLFSMLGVGYYWHENHYSSLSYQRGSSLYKNETEMRYLSWFEYYKIDQSWFVHLRYTYGLNTLAMDQKIGGDIGYRW